MNNQSGLSGTATLGSSKEKHKEVNQGTILVIDDRVLSRMTVVDLLTLEDYEVIEADTNKSILQQVEKSLPDLILLDVSVAEDEGFELCKRLKQEQIINLIPIIIFTVSNDRQSRLKCIEAGGDELMTKPLDRVEFLARVKSLIAKKQLNEGLDQTEQVLFSLARAIENRYSDGNNSSVKLAALTKSFGRYLQLCPSEIEDLTYAAHLHDIGTVGIPDSVMRKKGELTPEEQELLRQHVLIGEKICRPMRNRQGILPIIRHHHERWDGTGYPDGLKAREIPFLAQVFQTLDIYDALTSQRTYKQAYTPEEALEIMLSEADKGWRNPELVKKFSDFIRQEQRIQRVKTT